MLTLNRGNIDFFIVCLSYCIIILPLREGIRIIYEELFIIKVLSLFK